MSKCKHIEDCGDVHAELLQVLRKYDISYCGFKFVWERIKELVENNTYIDFNDDMKERLFKE